MTPPAMRPEVWTGSAGSGVGLGLAVAEALTAREVERDVVEGGRVLLLLVFVMGMVVGLVETREMVFVLVSEALVVVDGTLDLVDVTVAAY